MAVGATGRAAPRPNPRIASILASLARVYPAPKCALDHRNPLELLVATVLSAQCTDERVNQVTAHLFAKYRSAEDYAAAPQSRLEADIRSTGFYRNKAKAIRGFCQALVERHGGQVPQGMDELIGLPGVGRKTANLIRAEAFGLPGMVVDTHVRRLSQRLGMTDKNDPDKIEMDLVKLVPEKQWNALSLRLIAHGRRICKARSPLCHQCTLLKNCPTGVSRV